jgi:hypothetical protein
LLGSAAASYRAATSSPDTSSDRVVLNPIDDTPTLTT